MGVRQRMPYGFSYNVWTDLHIEWCKSFDRTILFVIHEVYFWIYIWIWLISGIQYWRGMIFSQTTKGLYCDFFIHDPLSQAGEQRGSLMWGYVGVVSTRGSKFNSNARERDPRIHNSHLIPKSATLATDLPLWEWIISQNFAIKSYFCCDLWTMMTFNH